MEEIERHWSLYDLLDAHEALDIRHEAEEFRNREIETKAKRGRR